MKVKRLRGMRDLTTVQGLAGRSVPHSREQVVAEQARLEHERTRLQRELAMWQDNQQRTNDRLAAVEERLALLASAIAPAESAPRPAPRRSGDPATPDTEWHEIVLEY